jgi:hypothetical protein
MTVGVLYFAPRPLPPSLYVLDPGTAEYILRTIFFCLFLLNYLLFGVLAAHGVHVAYRLRHGEARYADNYKVATQKRIDRLKKKFPQLMKEFGGRLPPESTVTP